MQTNIMKIKLIIYISLILVFSACSKKETAAVDSVKLEDESQSEEITPVAVSKEDISVLECFGYIDVPPTNVLEVYARAEGYVSKLDVLEGTIVKQGSILGRIESPTFVVMQKELLLASAEWDFQQGRYDRLLGLHEKGAISDAEMNEAHRDYKSAEADFLGMKQELDAVGFNTETILKGELQKYLLLRSEIAGMVTEVHASNGQLISPSEHLFTIVDKNHLHVELQVPVSDIGKIAIGDVFDFIPLGSSDTIQGEIHLINDAIEKESNTIRVHGHLEDESNGAGLSVGERVFVFIRH